MIKNKYKKPKEKFEITVIHVFTACILAISLFAFVSDTQAYQRITIPGFYDEVEELSQEVRNEMAKAPFDENEFKASIGINAVQGEEGYSNEERRTIRPSLDINGIWGGSTGEGAKTVIASKAYPP